MSESLAALATLEDSLTDEERDMLDRFADAVVRRRLTAAAIFFLESVKPLGFVTSQTLIVLRPLVQAVWTKPETYDRITNILARRGSIELVLRRIERRAE